MQKALIHWNDKKTKVLVYVLIALYLMLFLPFWKPVLLGFLFASAFSPLVNIVRRKLHTKRTGIAYLTVAIGLILFIGFLVVIGLQIYSQIYDFTQNKEALSSINDKISNVRDQILSFTSSKPYLASLNVKAQLDKAVVGITDASKNLLLAGAGIFVSRAPAILLNLAIFLLSFGAFMVIQPRIWANISQALRIEGRGREHFERFEKICTLALGSVLLTAFLQATIITIGSAIAGFGALVMIFGISFLCSFIPVLGAGTVPVVLMIVSFLGGNSTSGLVMLATAVIVAIADNLLRAWLFSRAAESNAVISIITLLGGVALFGFPGLFIAPVIQQLVMTYAFSDEDEPEVTEVTTTEKPKSPEAYVDHSGPNADHEPRLV